MRLRPAHVAAGCALAFLTGCTNPSAEELEADPSPVSVSVEAPAVGACRMLSTDDIRESSNDTEPVACSEPHTAEAFVVEEFGGRLASAEREDPSLAARVYKRCQREFIEFTGGTESLVMRSMLTWAWFRPTEEQWDAGARWFRCDAIGGGEHSDELFDLPVTARGALLGQPDDRWMLCADGPTVAGSVKVSCDQPHTWRAATTIVLGKPEAPYPGKRVAEVRTRDFCSESVGAWLGFPLEYDYGYTWFHEADWEAGNRRSICWAKTDR